MANILKGFSKIIKSELERLEGTLEIYEWKREKKMEREMGLAKLRSRILLVLSRKHMFIWKRFWLDRLFV